MCHGPTSKELGNLRKGTRNISWTLVQPPRNLPNRLLLADRYFNIWKFPTAGGITVSLLPDKSRFLNTLVSFSIPGGIWKAATKKNNLTTKQKISRVAFKIIGLVKPVITYFAQFIYPLKPRSWVHFVKRTQLDCFTRQTQWGCFTGWMNWVMIQTPVRFVADKYTWSVRFAPIWLDSNPWLDHSSTCFKSFQEI